MCMLHTCSSAGAWGLLIAQKSHPQLSNLSSRITEPPHQSCVNQD
jgi:hypothetical protein